MLFILVLSYITSITAQVIFAHNNLPVFSSSKHFFEQNIDSIPLKNINYTNFGLLSNYTFSQVVASLSPDEKLLLLQRHQQGWHNVAPGNYSRKDWRCNWSLKDGDGKIEWYDAELTPLGVSNGIKLSEKISNHEDFPRSDNFYVSPLRRCLQTWNLTWGNSTDKQPIIKEYAREVYGIDTESERHNKSFIHENWPEFKFEPGFSELDPLWKSDLREKNQHVDYRAASLLTELFETDDKVVSIVTHSGIMYAILRVVKHRSINLPTGALLPIIIKKENITKSYPLNDAYLGFNEWCTI
ncbi:unnamed protein product [Candida verbasci]|uniref:Uncharacterized protein n=1 Tax=Candida verbasci TaxID=1227364 RepID=A0A9W4XLY4_9ASCO|nr:unnamed protein product [Candida verbasci]